MKYMVIFVALLALGGCTREEKKEERHTQMRNDYTVQGTLDVPMEAGMPPAVIAVNFQVSHVGTEEEQRASETKHSLDPQALAAAIGQAVKLAMAGTGLGGWGLSSLLGGFGTEVATSLGTAATVMASYLGYKKIQHRKTNPQTITQPPARRREEDEET